MSRLLAMLLVAGAAGCYRSSAHEHGPGTGEGTAPGATEPGSDEGRFVGGGDDCRTDWIVVGAGEGEPLNGGPSSWEARDGRIAGDLGWVLDVDAENVTVRNGLPTLHESGEQIDLEAAGPDRAWVVGLSVLLFGGAGHEELARGSSRAYAIDAPPEPGDGHAFVTVIGQSGAGDRMTFYQTADTVTVTVSEGATPDARRFELDAHFPVPGAAGCPEPGDAVTASFELAPR